jgi:hypothetical protein
VNKGRELHVSKLEKLPEEKSPEYDNVGERNMSNVYPPDGALGNIEPDNAIRLAVLNNKPSGTIWTNMNDHSSTKA